MECNCTDHRVSITDSDHHLNTYKPRKTCGQKLKKYGRRKLPMLSWLPKYKLRYLLSDLIGGITVWLTAVPQSMGEAVIAGLTPEYGLYSHVVGPLVYLFLGSCRQVIVGPTAVMSLLTYETCGPDFPECVILFAFYSGVVEMVLGLLELGVIISFISEPVTVGFTAGAAVTIASSQIKDILGLAAKSKGSKFIQAWELVFDYGDTIALADSVLGLTCLTAILLLWKIEHLKCPKWFPNQKLWKRVMKGLTLTRNATVMFMSCILAYLWTDPPFALTGEVKQGFPDISAPMFQLTNPKTNSTMSFTETLEFVGTGPVSVAVVAVLQNIAIGKAFGHGQKVDGTQEMVALGTTNIIGSFMSGIPATGSFTRSALNHASGTKSQLNGLFLGGLMVLSLGVLTPLFQFIPKASLSAVIIAAMILILNTDVQVMFKIWKFSKIDFLCCIVTFLCSLGVGIEYGIVIGAGVNILIILAKSLRPRVTVQCFTDKETRVKYVLLQPDQGLYFPSVDYIRDKVNKISTQYPNFPVTVIDCEKWTHWDFSAASTIASLGGNYGRMGKKLVLYKANLSWSPALDSLGNTDTVCCANAQELHQVFQSFLIKALNAKEDSNNNN